MDVVKRLIKVLEIEKVSASKFADLIGINRAAMSHYLNGRNNPSLDVLNKIIDCYPNINPLWLLRGDGQMYLFESSPDYNSNTALFQKEEKENDTSVNKKTSIEPKTTVAYNELTTLNTILEKESNPEIEKKTESIPPLPLISSIEIPSELNIQEGRAVKKIILMYSDSTFAVFEETKEF